MLSVLKMYFQFGDTYRDKLLKDVKEVGAYKAAVKLHKDVTAEVAFEVVAEEA